MQEAESIRSLKSYAEGVLAALQGEPTPPDPATEPIFQEIQAVAEETIWRAGQPVKIGIVGEFNAGKSLLLGSLIGYADALPVSEVPTTGNVTALHLCPRAELKQTTLGPFRVEFLDQETAIDCLHELLRVADERARDANLPAAERKVLVGLRERAGQAPWGEVEGWCRSAWSHGGDHPNPALRHLLRELTWFARCCRSTTGQTLLQAKDVKDRTFEIDAETAREGLALPRSSSSIAVTRFDTLPGEPGSMLRPITPAWLRGAFPLIRRVDIVVGISQRIWDLSATQGAGEWVLLDFPGLGAAESGVRDAFLCKRELREVQTILILLDGRRPGGEGGQVIFSMMNADRPPGQDLRDSILVVMNRFDQLPIQADGGELILDRLVSWQDPNGPANRLPPADPEPLAEAEALRQLPVLSAMVVGARNLTRRDDRIVLLSALWALGDLRDELPGDVPVGSPEFMAGLAGLLKSPPPLRQKWERLAALLRDAEPGSSLARWLDDAARDGGAGRLQRLVADHVAHHGLKQLLDYVRAAAEGLRAAVAKLPKRRPSRPAGTGPSTETIRLAVDGLYDVYTALKAEYDQSPPELTVAVDARRIPLSQMVYDRVTQSVFEWPVWNELLNKVQKDGTVQIAPSSTPGRRGWDDGEEDLNQRLPTDTREFFPSFKQSLEDNEKMAGDCVRQAVREQLAALAKRARPFAEPIASLLSDVQIRQRVEEWDRREREAGRRVGAKGQFNILSWAADPQRPEVGERFLETYLQEPRESVPAEACFPLPGANPGEAPIKLPWARATEAGGNHQVMVLRLRDSLADAMRRRVLQQVSQLHKQALDGLADTYTVWSERLLLLSGNAPLLAQLAGESPATPGRPEWKTAAVPYPLAETSELAAV
jgi:hypothetical protein